METLMENSGAQPLNAEFLKKRKFYLMVPVLVLPFLTMAFWSLGGGKGNNGSVSPTLAKGINLALPSAQFKNKESGNKLDIYQSTAKDSANINKGLNNDFARSMGFDPGRPDSSEEHASTATPQTAADLQSERITAKLAEINRQINASATPSASTYQDAPEDRQVKKLNRMMRAMNSPTAKDPEMEQLNHMLNKIQAIQNPDRNYSKPTEKKKSEAPFKRYQP